ncbi:hypothetical protein [Actinosynnema sp. NPDC020468]|uniref:hypothetical protein n=1 Tax=Actinosynnema sp. NPDC020468 TaxID=3154488 RepID=UPI0033E33C3B
MIYDLEVLKARRRLTERLACTLLFTAVQAWAAAVIFTSLETSGVVALAVAFVLAGGLVAVYDAWRDVRVSRRALGAGIEEEQQELVRL